MNNVTKATELPLEALVDYIAETTSDAPNLQLPSPELRTFYRDEKDRIIWLQGEVDFNTLDVVKKIMRYNRDDLNIPVDQRTPIKIIIDTNGGSVAAMWSVINAIKISKTPVYTVNLCECLSAGAHILAAGHKRFGMPGSTILIHSGSCMYSGTQEQAESAKKYYDALGKKADDQLLADTEIDPKVFKKRAPFDWFIDETDALKFKLIDKIVADFEEIF